MTFFRSSLLALTLLLGSTSASFGQTYDLQFVPSVTADQDTLNLLIQIRVQDGQYPMGSGNLVFSFNDAVLSFPANDAAVAGKDYTFYAFDGGANYNAASVTSSAGNIAVNVSNKNNGSGTDVSTAWTNVATVRLRILDASGTSSFAWDATNTSVAAPTLTPPQYWTQGTLSTQADVDLPVELAAFEAVASGGAIQLFWTTLSETNNAGFEVQLAHEDSASFRAAAFVEGHGTTSAEHAYTYRHAPGAPGTYRVRLKQIDFDGAATYLPEVEVAVTQLENAEGLPVDVVLDAPSPNPFSDRTTLTLQLATTQHVRAGLFNTLGQRVATLLDRSVAGGTTQRLVVEAAGLAPGLYLLRVEGDTFTETRELVLVR